MFLPGFSRYMGAEFRSSIFQPSVRRQLWSLPTRSNISLQLSTLSVHKPLSMSVMNLSSRITSLPFICKAAGVTSVGIGLSIYAAPNIFCEPVAARTSPPPVSSPSGAAPLSSPEPFPEPPTSSVSYLELSFGTITGICAGVFVKKGAKALAFVLGGVFVLLQYLGSMSLIRVDWARASSRFESLLYTKDASGQKRAPSVGSLFRWLIDFLTADFQQRASFIAGFGLGLRIG
ncbi:uncharacterized protein FIBRA_00431 [Fibroporia radiculosa]|uniref:FUN14 domain-containing protein n=1 Tax=Fibroporia radiculosa TaxID=599839 RepID=J4GZZ7_9APHY|nr:uncharacterized protein FIBRA_00431 [Fibroporia radiculosa]CCL98434.1 predicted protein [Fibroporia radiculosa]